MDPIDAAIANADQPQPIRMVRLGPIVIQETGRPVFLEVPEDMTEAELLAFVAWAAAPPGMRAMLRPQRRGPQLLIPTGPPRLQG